MPASRGAKPSQGSQLVPGGRLRAPARLDKLAPPPLPLQRSGVSEVFGSLSTAVDCD